MSQRCSTLSGGTLQRCPECQEEVKNLTHHQYSKHINVCTIRYPTHEIEDSAQRDEEAQEEQEEVEVIRNPTTGKFHCARCVFATTHGPTLQVHARRQCKLLGGILPQDRVATQKPRSQRGLSFSPPTSAPLALPCPTLLGDIFFPVGDSPRFIYEKRLSPRVEMSPTSSVEAREVEEYLLAEEMDDDASAFYESPAQVPEFLEGSSRDGTEEQLCSRSSSPLSYVDFEEFYHPTHTVSADIKLEDNDSSISSRRTSASHDRTPSSATSWSRSIAYSSSPISPICRKDLHSDVSHRKLDPRVLGTLGRLSPPYSNMMLDVLATSGITDSDRLNLSTRTPTPWEVIREHLMERGMNIMEWMSLRKSLLRRLGFRLNTKRDYGPQRLRTHPIFTFLDSLTMPSGDHIPLPTKCILNLGFYLLSDIQLLASYRTQWSIAGSYFISEGLTYPQWLALKRGLRDLFHISKFGLPPIHRSLHAFLSNLHFPMNHKGQAFNEIGIDSGEELDLLCRVPGQWDSVFPELQAVTEVSEAEWESVREGMEARRIYLNGVGVDTLAEEV